MIKQPFVLLHKSIKPVAKRQENQGRQKTGDTHHFQAGQNLAL